MPTYLGHHAQCAVTMPRIHYGSGKLGVHPVAYAPRSQPLSSASRARITQRGAFGTLLVVATLLLTSCSGTDDRAHEVTMTPVTPTPSAPPAQSDNLPQGPEPSDGPHIEYFYGDDVETEGSFVLDAEGIETTITMKAVGGIVTEQTTTNVFDYTTLGITSAEQAEQALADIMITVDDLEGFEQSIDYGDTEATQISRVDFAVFDLNDAQDLPGAMTSGVSEDAVVSYEENRKMLLEVGFVEVD